MYSPVCAVFAVWEAPVVAFFTVTLIPAAGAPDESRTIPERVALVLCADASGVEKANKKSHSHRRAALPLGIRDSFLIPASIRQSAVIQIQSRLEDLLSRTFAIIILKWNHATSNQPHPQRALLVKWVARQFEVARSGVH